MGIDVAVQRIRQFSRYIRTRDGFSARWLILAFFLAVALIFARDTSLFTHAQFYAEDGVVWYAQAYNKGLLHSLGNPEGGYLNTLQRLAAGVALFVPFRWAPLGMAIAGLLVQALPVPILISDRCRRWAPLSVRMAFAAVYTAIPNAREVHVVCTNSQWHLGLVLVLVALATAPRSVLARIFDVSVLAVASVSGPFPILSVPLVASFWAVRRHRWTLLVLAILIAGSAIQIVYLLHNGQQRVMCGALGATPALFVRLLGGNAFMAGLLGKHAFGLSRPFWWSLVALLIGLAVCAYTAYGTGLEIRLFFVYCFAIFAAGLHRPLICSATFTQWGALLTLSGQRYSFFPMLALLFAVLWCAAFAPAVTMRITGLILVLLLCVGIRRDWKIPPLADMGFARQAMAFEAAHVGSQVVILVYPPPGLKMVLIKKP